MTLCKQVRCKSLPQRFAPSWFHKWVSKCVALHSIYLVPREYEYGGKYQSLISRTHHNATKATLTMSWIPYNRCRCSLKSRCLLSLQAMRFGCMGYAKWGRYLEGLGELRLHAFHVCSSQWKLHGPHFPQLFSCTYTQSTPENAQKGELHSSPSLVASHKTVHLVIFPSFGQTVSKLGLGAHPSQIQTILVIGLLQGQKFNINFLRLTMIRSLKFGIKTFIVNHQSSGGLTHQIIGVP